jgi:2-keto-4-pentenoate hydratase/2-oxohepta-3-ene-1,7-dioic acid hydratase in catechol pathway
VHLGRLFHHTKHETAGATEDAIPDIGADELARMFSPPRWLRDGDEVTVEIERIGALTNRVRALEAPTRDGGSG